MSLPLVDHHGDVPTGPVHLLSPLRTTLCHLVGHHTQSEGIVKQHFVLARSTDAKSGPGRAGGIPGTSAGYQSPMVRAGPGRIASVVQAPAEVLSVTIARRHPRGIAAIAAPMPAAAAAPPPVPVSLGDAPAPDPVTPVGRLRRCTFRRIDRVSVLPGRADASAYEVMCLYGDVNEPLALGDVSSARPICEACNAAGIFRPDEA